jgi:hypothetical protein
VKSVIPTGYGCNICGRFKKDPWLKLSFLLRYGIQQLVQDYRSVIWGECILHTQIQCYNHAIDDPFCCSFGKRNLYGTFPTKPNPIFCLVIRHIMYLLLLEFLLGSQVEEILYTLIIGSDLTLLRIRNGLLKNMYRKLTHTFYVH